MDNLVIEYRNLMNSIDFLDLNQGMKQDLKNEKRQFEKSFIKIKCEVLNSRAEVEEILDDLNYKNGLMRKKQEELTETNEMIEHYKSQIKKLKK